MDGILAIFASQEGQQLLAQLSSVDEWARTLMYFAELMLVLTVPFYLWEHVRRIGGPRLPDGYPSPENFLGRHLLATAGMGLASKLLPFEVALIWSGVTFVGRLVG